MANHTPEMIAAAKEVLVTRLRKWDAELGLEAELGRDLLMRDDEAIDTLCVMLGDPEDVTDAQAVELLTMLEENTHA